MRNLKKVMALALATVMLFGMMVMGAGAADYKDADLIDAAKYGTAVDLLNAIGAFQGNADGTLNPKGTLTRAEAAVSIAKLALTKDVAAKLNAAVDTGFADVDAGYAWASGAIAYAKQLGIVSGVTTDKYDPAGTLTGYAYAKMLLVVLGYNADTEGYKGDNWESNINLDAIQAGLLNGLTINLGDAILREQAIQMAANALVADCVEYKTAGSTIVLPDGTTISNGGSGATAVAKAEGGYKNEGNDTTLQLIEKLYPTFKLIVDDKDENGFAQKTWMKGTTEVASEANYTVLKTYTGAIADVKTGTIYADAGYVKQEGVKIYENGLDTLVTADTVKIEKDGGAKPGTGYNGATMKYVKNGADYVIVIEFPTLATVSKVNAATATKGASVELNVNGLDGKALTIETDAYAKDAKVLITTGVKDGKTVILTHKAAAVVTGTVTETEKDNVAIYIDGTKYPVAGAKVATLPTFKLGTKYNFVVENGYIIGLSDVAGAPAAKPSLEKVYYVGAISETVSDGWGGGYKMAKLISLADYTVVDQKITSKQATISGLVTIEDEKEGTTKTGMKELKAYTGATEKVDGVEYGVFGTDTFVGDLKVTDKSVELTEKTYFTASSVILTIENIGKTTVKATAAKAPVDATIAASDVIVALNESKAGNKANEVEMIIVLKADVTLNETPVTNMYYVLSGDLGKVYDAELKKTLKKVEAVDLKTFEKATYYVAEGLNVVGFAEGKTVKGAEFTFEAKAVSNTVKVAKDAAVDVYNTLITVGVVENADFANAKFYNAAGVKDANNKTITSIADLVKDGKAAGEFVMKYTKNATTGVYTVDYVVVTAK